MSCCVAVLFVLGSIVPSTDSNFVPPRVIAASQVVPVYPPAALAGRFEGVVELRATVRADGTVRSVDVLGCDHPQLGFEAASSDAVRAWRFEPARRGGEAIEAATTLRVRFQPGGPAGRGRSAYVTLGSASADTPRSSSGVATIAAKR